MNRGKLLNDVLSNVGKLFVVSSDELFDCTMVTNLKARRREAIKERASRQALRRRWRAEFGKKENQRVTLPLYVESGGVTVGDN